MISYFMIYSLGFYCDSLFDINTKNRWTMWKCSECNFACNPVTSNTCEQCHAKRPEKTDKKEGEKKAGIDYENLLKKIAWGILVLGILGSIVMIFTIGYTDTLYGIEVDWMIMRYVIFSFISSILSWVVLNVLANISCRLKSIDEKLG